MRKAEHKEIKPLAQGYMLVNVRTWMCFIIGKVMCSSMKSFCFVFFGYLYDLCHFYQYMKLDILLFINKSLYFLR